MKQILFAAVLACSVSGYSFNGRCFSGKDSYNTCCSSDENEYECDSTAEPDCNSEIYGYNPPYPNLICSSGASISLEFLYFYSREQLPHYGREDLYYSEGDSSTVTGTPLNYYYLGSNWNPGFRVSIGSRNPCVGCGTFCNGWDLTLTWTYYKSSIKDSQKTELTPYYPEVNSFNASTDLLGENLVSKWVTGAEFPFNYLSAKWGFKINQIDWVAGKKYWVSPCFTAKPYGGLRGAWTNTNYEVVGESTFIDASDPSTTEFLRNGCEYNNKFLGIGLLSGINFNWYWSPCISLYGGSGISLLWSEYKLDRISQIYSESDNDGAITINTDSEFAVKSKVYSMQPIVDVELGLSCESSWCCNRFITALQVGWEYHYLLDHNFRVPVVDSLSDDANTALLTDDALDVFTSVTFGGFVARIRFDF